MNRKSMATSWPESFAVRLNVAAERLKGVAHTGFDYSAAALRSRPRLSLAASGLLALGLIFPLIHSGPDGSPAARVKQLELPPVIGEASAAVVSLPAAPELSAEAGGAEPVDEADGSTVGSGDGDWQIVRISPGQTLERVFLDLGLGAGLLHEIVAAADSSRDLARIRPGDEFAFDIDPHSGFRALRTELDEGAWLYIERDGEGLNVRSEARALDHRVVEAHGTISSSLYRNATEAGLSDAMIMRLATIFGWDIDFALDIRAGDRFALIYEQVWRDGEYIRDGAILAARFVNQGSSFEAVRYDAGNGPDYFAPDGRPMRKAFLRTPLNFTRVSSNFNPSRLHPVTRQVRPHNGTDYAAPTGTPVWAAGDGRVIEAGYNRANGNYIFVQHGNNIVTRYLHLSRKQVKQGSRVRQGQVIGQVGATGLATGPHLHYEFLVNGVHRNPRTVDLPPAEPLSAEHMVAFGRIGQSLLAQLDRFTESGAVLALSERCDTLAHGC